MKTHKIILSIESAIEGGSISLKKDSIEIDFWVGTKAVSRSEDLLAEIDSLLLKNKIEKKHIKLVAVADSVGSRTGLRIGLSTGLGIKSALNCELQTFSVISSASALLAKEKSITAIFLNENTVFFQEFERFKDNRPEENEIKTASANEVLKKLSESGVQFFLINPKFFDFLTNHSIEIPKNIKLINLGKNLARYFNQKL